MTVRTRPCDWPTIGCDDCTALAELDGEGESALYDVIVGTAVEYLWNWTGRVYGLCEVTLRPCRKDCLDYTTYRGHGGIDRYLPRTSVGPWQPALIDGTWRNIWCGLCGETCSCSKVEQLKLPGPVDSIDEVRIDGEVVDPSAYRVDNHNLLVRDDGGEWPRCQDLAKPAGEEGTWTVTYQIGVAVPEGGQVAAGKLACEMAKAFCGDKSCKLPVRVSNISREGITIGAILDSFDDLERGRTGIWLVDSWVASMNAPKRQSTIHYPGKAKARTTTYRGAS